MTRPGRSDSPSADPLFAVAMLRIALELKKPQNDVLDAIVSRVVARMQLDADAFRRYLAVNVGLLQATRTPATAANLEPARASAPRRRTQRG
jgi:hypothetical protein